MLPTMVNNIQRPEKGFGILQMNPAFRGNIVLVFEQQECKKHIIPITHQAVQARDRAAAVSICAAAVSVHAAVVSVHVAVAAHLYQSVQQSEKEGRLLI